MSTVTGTQPIREEWLTVQQACALIGVAPATLRRWSAAGSVPAFTTPGGHRRFARSMILGLLPSASTAPALVAVEPQPPLASLLRRRLAEACRDAEWLARLAPGQQAALREHGRVIVQSLLACVDEPSGAVSDEALSAAAAAAGACGRIAAEAAASVGETVETFLRVRRLFLAELVTRCRHRDDDTSTLVDLLAAANQFGDRLHVALIAGHQAEMAQRPPRGEGT